MIRNSCRVRESGARACAAYVPRFRGCDRNKSRVTRKCKSRSNRTGLRGQSVLSAQTDDCLCGLSSLSYSCLIRYRDVCLIG